MTVEERNNCPQKLSWSQTQVWTHSTKKQRHRLGLQSTGIYSSNILCIFFTEMEEVHFPESCPHSSLTLAHKLPCLLEESWSGLGPCSLGDLASSFLQPFQHFSWSKQAARHLPFTAAWASCIILPPTAARLHNNVPTNISYLVLSIAESVYPSPAANQYALFHKLEHISQPTAYLKVWKFLVRFRSELHYSQLHSLSVEPYICPLSRWVLLMNLHVFPGYTSLGKLICSPIYEWRVKHFLCL